MASGASSRNGLVSIRVAALVLVVFIVGLISGTMLFQYLSKSPIESISHETLDITHAGIWFTNSGAEAVISIVNSEREDAIIKKIVIRGVQGDWSDVYYWRSASPISTFLEPATLSGTSFVAIVDGYNRTFLQANSELGLASHWTIVLYIRNAGNMTPSLSNDFPPKVTIAIYTENNLYYKEVDVPEPSFSFMFSGESLQLGSPWNWQTTTPYYVYINVTNAGIPSIVISSVRIDSQPANMSVVWTSFTPSSNTIPKGEKACIQISRTTPFTAGTQYTFTIVTGNNKEFSVTGVSQGQ